MEKKVKHLIKINLPGGVISAGDLYEILVIAKKSNAEHVRFGNRQQLYFEVLSDQFEDLEYDMLSADIDYEVDADTYPNIISSYVADTVFNHDNWVKEGVYKDIFDLFNFKPKLKINLTDSNQTFVPYFTGNLNFISSDVSNYWYLYVRYPKTNILYCWPVLIYSDDIPDVCKKIESVIFLNKDRFYDQPEIDSELFYEQVMAKSNFVIQQLARALKIPEFHLPYYEGFNKYGSKYWLGIYRRDELFAVDFLMDCCTLCTQTRVGQLYITPWKSILIKGIELADRNLWGIILNKYRVNVRHAANEMNWQIEDVCDYCLDLKKHLVRYFEEADLRTYRLSFAIKKQPKTGLFGSIIIRRQQEVFEIIHTRDFNPNSKDFIVYKQNVKKQQLSKHLAELCNYFYSLQSADYENAINMVADEEDLSLTNSHVVYQCQSCLSIYDNTYGDIVNGIAAETDFETIDEYLCPVCEAPKEAFVMMEQNLARSY
jgi:rubredoxin